MAVRAHERVEVGDGRLALRTLDPRSVRSHRDVSELLDVQLMADARSRRDDAHVVEALLRPLQELVALAIARELKLHVARKRPGAPRFVGDHRMVNHEIARNLRVDLRRIAPQLCARLAHDREVHEHRNAREILEQHASG